MYLAPFPMPQSCSLLPQILMKRGGRQGSLLCASPSCSQRHRGNRASPHTESYEDMTYLHTEDEFFCDWHSGSSLKEHLLSDMGCRERKQGPKAMCYGLFSNKGTFTSQSFWRPPISSLFLFYRDAFLSLSMEKSQRRPLPVFIFLFLPYWCTLSTFCPVSRSLSRTENEAQACVPALSSWLSNW